MIYQVAKINVNKGICKTCLFANRLPAQSLKLQWQYALEHGKKAIMQSLFEVNNKLSESFNVVYLLGDGSQCILFFRRVDIDPRQKCYSCLFLIDEDDDNYYQIFAKDSDALAKFNELVNEYQQQSKLTGYNCDIRAGSGRASFTGSNDHIIKKQIFLTKSILQTE